MLLPSRAHLVRTGRLPAVLALQLAAVLLGGCNQPSAASLALAPPEVSEEVGLTDDWVLEYVRTIGPGVLPPSFVFRGPMGMGRDGRLITMSNADCKTAVLHTTTGAVERYFGRCGDGPHETRSIGGIGIARDTILRLSPFGGRIEFVGSDDTVVRVLRVDPLVQTSIRNVQSFEVVDDTTAFVAVVRLPAGLVESDDDWLFAFVDLRDGTVRPHGFREPARRTASIEENMRFYSACMHGKTRTPIIINNGPVEVVALGEDGAPRWARSYAVPAIRPITEPLNRNTAAFIWNHLPRPPACGGSMAAILAMPIDGAGMPPVLGHLILLDYEGRTLMNHPFADTDSILAMGGWEADDSLFYVSARLSPTPALLVLRPRPRRPGEQGVVLLPDSVIARLNADPLEGVFE